MNETEANPNERGIVTPLRLVIALFVIGATLVVAGRLLFPDHPASWYRIHDTRDMSIAEVRSILSSSGAQLVSTVGRSETWRLSQRFGAWSVSVSPDGEHLLNAHVRYDSTVFPSLIRRRNYPNPDPQ